MRIRSVNISLLAVFLLAVLISSPAYAQAGQISRSGKGMNSGMMQSFDFAQYDSRFNDFGSMTFKEVSDIFGVPVEVARSDLELPEGVETQLTVLEIEEQYGVSGQEIASYMVMNMQQMNSSLNLREKLLMRQQAIQATRAGRGEGMFFMRQGSFACGNYTSFNFNKSGIIKNFAVGGNLLFDSVEILDFEYLDEQITETTAFYQGVESQVLIKDSPTGIFQIRAFANKTITFNLADGVKARLEENVSSGLENTVPIKITANNFEGDMVFFRNPCAESPLRSINGTDTEISEDNITVKLVEDSVIMFRAIPMQPSMMQTEYRYDQDYAYLHQVLNREITTGRFGAEIIFRANSDQVSVTNYAPVNLRVRDRDQDRIVLCIESEMPDGRVVSINVDNETINLTNQERLRIRYDGQAVEEAGSIDELFKDRDVPLCYKLEEKGTASIAVYVPDFSEHEIIIDLAPVDRHGAAGVLEIDKTVLSADKFAGIREETTGDGEWVPETGEPEAQNERNEAEPSPAFELGFATAVLATAYGLRSRK